LHRRESTLPISDSLTDYALDSELTDFCSCLHITPVIREFHDEDNSDHLSVSNHSSDVEEESELKRFTQALQTAQIAALTRENRNKKGFYSKRSADTQRRCKKLRVKLVLDGFLPVDEYMRRKGVPVKHNAPTPELDKINLREESEEGSDEANTPDRDTCTYSSINSASEVESEGSLPGNLRNVQHCLRQLARMESEESGGDDDGDDGVEDYARHHMNNETEIMNDQETCTTSRRLEDLRHEAALVHQEASQGIPGSTLWLLGDHFKLREAIVQLTDEGRRSDLDVIVQARVAAMVGLLNLYTDENLGYSWRRASEMVAKMQGRGMNHARHIHEWVLGFLRWRDLPLHQLNRKRGMIIEDEDVAEEIRTRMKEKASNGFLKAQDLVEIVASPDIQGIFAQKGITKATISVKTALRWLDKLGWTYGKLKNGMYLDGHEGLDVVEYRRAFVECWKGHERRFHRWDHDGTELPRPNGFPVPGAIGRFRLILVTHDESTFFQNDERNTGWTHVTSKSKPKAKGNGQTLMVSDFLTPDWGRLRDGDE